MSDFFNIQNKKIMYLTFTRLSKKRDLYAKNFIPSKECPSKAKQR